MPSCPFPCPFPALLLRDWAPLGLSNRSCESMPLRAGCGCAAPPSPTAANTFSMPSNPPPEGRSADLSLRGARSVRQKSYASYTRRRVHSFQLQGSASTPLAPIAAATPDSNFSLRIEVARPTSSSSQRERGPQSPAQPCPLNIQRPSLSYSNIILNMLITKNREKGYAPAKQEDEGPPGRPGGICDQNTFGIR
jgi:hypothetical protein